MQMEITKEKKGISRGISIAPSLRMNTLKQDSHKPDSNHKNMVQAHSTGILPSPQKRTERGEVWPRIEIIRPQSPDMGCMSNQSVFNSVKQMERKTPPYFLEIPDMRSLSEKKVNMLRPVKKNYQSMFSSLRSYKDLGEARSGK